MAQQPKDASQKSSGLFFGTIGLMFSIAIWCVLSLFFSIIIEWVGILFSFWEDSHSQTMLEQEIAWLNQDFVDTVVSPKTATVSFLQWFYGFLFVWFDIDIAKGVLSAVQGSFLAPYINSAFLVTQVFAVRLVVILFSLPVFVLLGIVAFTDGLAVRDLRRWGGDRESGYVWHLVSSKTAWFVIVPIVLYLSSPWSIHPNFIIGPFCGVFAICVWISTAKFKKYL